MGKLSSLLKLKPFVRKYKTIFILGILGMVLASLIETPVPYIIGHITDKVLIGKGKYSELYEYLGAIAVLYILSYGISIAARYAFVKISSFVVNEMRYSVMKKVMDLPMSYLSSTQKGYVQGRISECSSVGSIFSPGVISTFLSVIDASLAIITMFIINYKLAFAAVILAPLFYFSSKSSTSSFMKSTKELVESSAVLNGECFEIINGIEDIKILNAKNQHLVKFDNKLKTMVANTLKQGKSMIFFSQNIGLINDFGGLLILLISAILILKGQFTVGLYTSFSLYITKVFSCAQAIASMGTMIKPACLNIERLYELLDMKDENEDKNESITADIDCISLDKVAFAYKEKEKKVFENLSFKISKGEKVLLKGENGAGKSTLIKLLIGLYPYTEGEILYNSIPVNNINTESLREKVAVVSQNIFLFRGTVLDNILYGLEDKKKRKDVEHIIKELKLEEYVARFPKGIDTEISQNTAGVSGGQAQIIAFLRAMVSGKEVIILDEPLANLDAETRELILNILNEIQIKGILIVVSHISDNMNFREIVL
ncbi:ABC transporter ATP-binding protein [Clostridium sp. 19966]|uniref:ABC transporter ATP-binding protein n=1 Tax=Clostridium sp. 19966 TaxID=2768166 RepID=UPI0028DFD8EF|nr:ABC transporter ATP-binding protein [Clostridium sp. 19966]MDT8717593.1 ABC transporter ATP-binding protein [Clostridium sp. 19966]